MELKRKEYYNAEATSNNNEKIKTSKFATRRSIYLLPPFCLEIERV